MDSWLDEDVDEVKLRNEMVKKLDNLIEKTELLFKENGANKASPKHVRFKTIVITHTITRLPQEMWYSRQEYLNMRS